MLPTILLDTVGNDISNMLDILFFVGDNLVCKLILRGKKKKNTIILEVYMIHWKQPLFL